MTENLFSYGTLQDRPVQLSLFGRELQGKPDHIVGYKLSQIEITDPEVLATSGLTHHPILLYSGDKNDVIKGMVFKITGHDLIQADEYETSDYKRIRVPLKSGDEAWVYIDAKDSMETKSLI